MKKNVYGALTGDVINFTKLHNHEKQVLIKATEALIKTWVSVKEDAAVFRGDSYQILFDDPAQVTRRSIQLICWFTKKSKPDRDIRLSTRISIGIGQLDYRGKSVLDADGQALHLSGRRFDKMVKGELLVITTETEELNEQLGILLMFINLLVSQWNINQAEVIYLLLEGYTQTSIAEELGIGQSAVNNRIKTARWKEVEKGLAYITGLITAKLTPANG